MDRSREQPWKLEFAEHLRRDQARLYGYIHSLVRNLNDADDVFQQTTLVLWKKFEDFDPTRSFFAWACGVAHREVLNLLRHRGRDRLYFSDELNLLLVEAHAEMADEVLEDRRDALAGCIDKLRRQDRELLDACYWTSIGVRGAAEQYGRSTQAVHNSLRRIRRALHTCIGRTLAQREGMRLSR